MEMKITMDTICIPSDNIVAREIENDIIIVPLVAGIGDADGELFTLNETGKAIWKRIDGFRTLGLLIEELNEEYSSISGEIIIDVLGFVTEMVRRGILLIKN